MIRDISRFDNWFSLSYYQIRNKLGCYLKLNEDTFHDTYLIIRINLLFEKTMITDFEPYFIGCYKKIALKGFIHEKRYCHPKDVFFEFLSDAEPVSIDDLLALDNLANDILSFVKKKFSENDYRLFRLRNFETQCSYKDLADYTGISPSQICKKVNNITNAARKDPDFKQRNSQLISINN